MGAFPSFLLVVRLFSKNPFSLNLKTDGKQQRINDAFTQRRIGDKSQQMVHQKGGEQELDNHQRIVLYE